MGITLTSKTINSTYDSLLKLSDNDSLTGAFKVITDGLGNDTGVSLNNTGDVTISGTLTVNTRINTPLLQLTGGTGTQGELSWNADEETLDLINNGAVLQLGQEIHIHVRNNSVTTAIPNGTPVYVAGTLGASGRLKVAPMIADGSVGPEYFIGVTTEEIEAGGDGKVTFLGKVRGFNTLAYAEGAKLYVSETVAGGWQTTHPTAPNPILEVAFVVNSNNNGTLFVRSQNGHYLDDTHDIEITSVADKDLLVYDSALGIWKNSKTLGDISTGNITTSGTVDGIDISVFKSDYDNHNHDSRYYTETEIDNTLVNYQLTSEKGQALGYAPLDSGAKIDESYLPDSIVGQVEYQGTWNAATNTPTLSTVTPPKGHYYIVSVAGTFDSIDYAVGDWIISDGIIWSKVDNTDAVTNFNGRLGGILPLSTDYDSFFYTKTLLDSGQLDNRYYTETELDAGQLDNRYYTETEADGKFLLNTTDTLTGNLTVTGDVSSDVFKGVTYPNNSFLKFDDDQTLNSNMTTLSSIGGLNLIWDSNNNDVSTFSIWDADGDVDLATERFQINGSGNARFFANLTVDGELSVNGTIDLSNADLNIGAADIIFDMTSLQANRGLVWDISGTGFVSKFVGGGTNGGMVELYTNMDNAITTGDVFRVKEGSAGDTVFNIDGNGYANIPYRLAIGKTTDPSVALDVSGAILALGNITTTSGNVYALGGNSTEWNTAYDYSQVGHLPLAGGTLSGGLTLDYAAPTIILYDPNTSTGNYPQIRFNTANNQGVKLIHNEFDGELPSSGYGLVLTGDDSNSQFPTTGTLSFVVHGEIFTGGTTNGTVNKVLHAGNYSSYITTSYVNGLNVNATTLDSIDSTGFIREYGTTAQANINTIGATSGKYRWNVTTIGRPAEAQANEYGTLLNLNYNGTISTQLAYDIAEANLWTRNLNTSTDTGTTWKKILDSGNFTTFTDSKYLRSDTSDTMNGSLTVTGTIYSDTLRDTSSEIIIRRESANNLIRIGSGVATDYLAFYSGASEKMRIDSSGRVGIGTTTPNTALQINQSTSIPLLVHRPNNTTFEPHGIAFSTRNDSNNVGLGDARAGIFYDYNGDLFLAATTSSSLSSNPAAYSRLFIDGGSGNVGIGTTSPAYKLDVNGDFRVGTAASRLFYIDSTNPDHLKKQQNLVFSADPTNVHSSTKIYFDIDSDTKMAILSSGNVGIGTTSPSAKLEIQGGATSTGGVIIQNGGGHPDLTLIGNQGNVYARFSEVGTTDPATFELMESGSTKIALKANGNTYFNGGNVGIGTTSPSAKLHINGGAGANTAKVIVGGNDAIIRLGDNQAGGPHGIQFDGYATTDGMSMYYRTTPKQISFEDSTGTSGSKIMVVGRDGNVGIGTTTPSAKLHLFNAGYPQMSLQSNGGTWQVGVSSGNDFAFRKGTTGSDYPLWLDSSGNVGIGTTSPSGKLDVNGQIVLSSDTEHYIEKDTTSLVTGSAVETTTISGRNIDLYAYDDVNLRAGTGDKITFHAGGGEKMRINSSGNVGVGTTSPSYKLDVNGTANVSGVFKVTAGASDPTKTTDSSQFVIDSSNQQLAIGVTGNGNGRYAWILARHDGFPTYGGFYCTLHLQPRVGSEEDYEGVAIGYGVTTKLPSDVSLACNDKVGIGTTNPADKLEVLGNIRLRQSLSNAETVYISTNSRGGGTNDADMRFGNSNNGDVMTIHNDSVGIGTTSPTYKLDVNGSIKGTGLLIDGSAYFDTNTGTQPVYITRLGGGSESLQIFVDDANVWFESIQDENTGTYGGYVFTMDGGGVSPSFDIRHGTTTRFRFEADGDFHADADIIAYSTTVSDRRLKDEIRTIPNALDKVKSMRGVSYVWNNGSRKGQKDLGLIAQEVEEVLPEVVREKEMPLMDDSGEKYKTVDYEKMVGVLIEAMKEQQEQIDELKRRLDDCTK